MKAERERFVRNRILWLVGAFALCFAVRAWFVAHTFEGAGDGSQRTLMAHLWSLNPVYISGTYYLPGLCYLDGSFLRLFPGQLVGVRWLHALIGATTPVFMFLLLRRVTGKFAAALSAACLALLPLHLGLSASGLAEAPYLACVIGSFTFLIYSFPSDGRGNCVDTPGRRPFFLVLAVLCLIIATTMRVEAWLLVPIFCGYVFAVAQNFSIAFACFLLLSAFPFSWMVGTYKLTGMPFLSFIGPSADPRNNSIGLLSAVSTWFKSSFLLQGPLLCCVPFLAPGLWLFQRRQWTKEFRLLFVLFLLQLFLVTSVSMSVGANVQERYYISFYVFSIPLFALCADIIWTKLRSSQTRVNVLRGLIFCALVIDSIWIPFLIAKPDIRVTTVPWRAETAVGDWIRNSKYRDSDVILTSDNYRCFFVPMQDLQHAKKYTAVIDFYTPYYQIRDELRHRNPRLVVVGKYDGADINYLRNVCNFENRLQPVFENEHLRVVELEPGTFRVKEDWEIKPMPCLFYPLPGPLTFFKPCRRGRFFVAPGF